MTSCTSRVAGNGGAVGLPRTNDWLEEEAHHRDGPEQALGNKQPNNSASHASSVPAGAVGAVEW